MNEKADQRTVLIVDDSTDNLRVLGEIVRRHGYRVRTAVSGEHALESVEALPPDLILLDIRMPGMDGFAVCRELQSRGHLDHIPVLFLSAVADAATKVEAFASGGVDYITKPFQAEEVLSRIDTHLSLQALRQDLEAHVKARTAALEKSQEELRAIAKRLRRLSARTAEIEEGERRRIAREIHDLIGPKITSLGIALERLGRLDENDEPHRQRAIILEDARQLLKEIAEHAHGVMSELSPAVLHDYGIFSAIRWHASRFSDRTGLEIRMTGADPNPRPESNVEMALYRATQEALNNVARHAQAEAAEVVVDSSDDAIRVVISDDGVGFDSDQLGTPGPAGGWGLLSMSERLELVGGKMEVESVPGRGTIIRMEVPR